MDGFTSKDFAKFMENEELRNIILKQAKKYIEKANKEKTEVDKKHDKIFKKILSIKEEAVKYIKRVYNIELSKRDIEVYDKEFVGGDGKQLEADIVYKVKDKKIFFLVEHQTKKDFTIPLRIVKYDVEIMKKVSAKRKGEKEALVLASVIHT